jgi:hypothetical protein
MKTQIGVSVKEAAAARPWACGPIFMLDMEMRCLRRAWFRSLHGEPGNLLRKTGDVPLGLLRQAAPARSSSAAPFLPVMDGI